ncbi:hypothetical protein [Streptomyces anulatus]|uniref:hypothetical protein n=1 Tax=Streptomyces anulatus TaxID=1892 RepID=UPI002E151E28|nr:hypothetical protein OG557_38895 [Streptomyces anulatus]
MACPTGKQRFRDDFEAKLALLRVTTSNSPRRQEKRAYHCPHCHGWHLTSQAKKHRKARQ